MGKKECSALHASLRERLREKIRSKEASRRSKKVDDLAYRRLMEASKCSAQKSAPPPTTSQKLAAVDAAVVLQTLKNMGFAFPSPCGEILSAVKDDHRGENETQTVQDAGIDTLAGHESNVDAHCVGEKVLMKFPPAGTQEEDRPQPNSGTEACPGNIIASDTTSTNVPTDNDESDCQMSEPGEPFTDPKAAQVSEQNNGTSEECGNETKAETVALPSIPTPPEQDLASEVCAEVRDLSPRVLDDQTGAHDPKMDVSHVECCDEAMQQRSFAESRVKLQVEFLKNKIPEWVDRTGERMGEMSTIRDLRRGDGRTGRYVAGAQCPQPDTALSGHTQKGQNVRHGKSRNFSRNQVSSREAVSGKSGKVHASHRRDVQGGTKMDASVHEGLWFGARGRKYSNGPPSKTSVSANPGARKSRRQADRFSKPPAHEKTSYRNFPQPDFRERLYKSPNVSTVLVLSCNEECAMDEGCLVNLHFRFDSKVGNTQEQLLRSCHPRTGGSGGSFVRNDSRENFRQRKEHKEQRVKGHRYKVKKGSVLGEQVVDKSSDRKYSDKFSYESGGECLGGSLVALPYIC